MRYAEFNTPKIGENTNQLRINKAKYNVLLKINEKANKYICYCKKS